MWFLYTAAISSIILILLLQQVRVTLEKKDKIRISIAFTLFEFSFTPKVKKKRRKRLSLLARSTAIFRTVQFLIPRANVTVVDNYAPNTGDAPLARALTHIPYYFTLYTSLAYLSARAKSFELITKDKCGEDGFLRLSFSLRLLFLIISLIIFQYYILKTKIKRGIKNV